MENQRPKPMPFALAQAAKLRTAIDLLEDGFEDDIDLDDLSITANALETLHARNQELEAMLDAVGAGGVSAQRVTQAADHIAQDRKMVAAQEPFGYFKAEPFGWTDCAETDEGAVALYEAPQPQADARDAELLKALGDLSFDCFDGFGTKAPSVEIYNRTFSVLEKCRVSMQGDAK